MPPHAAPTRFAGHWRAGIQCANFFVAVYDASASHVGPHKCTLQTKTDPPSAIWHTRKKPSHAGPEKWSPRHFGPGGARHALMEKSCALSGFAHCPTDGDALWLVQALTKPAGWAHPAHSIQCSGSWSGGSAAPAVQRRRSSASIALDQVRRRNSMLTSSAWLAPEVTAA